MNTQTLVATELALIVIVYYKRQGRWKLFREAAAGQYVLRTS